MAAAYHHGTAPRGATALGTARPTIARVYWVYRPKSATVRAFRTVGEVSASALGVPVHRLFGLSP